MSATYRSGLRGFSPLLALGGHNFVQTVIEVREQRDLFGPPAAPGWWRCVLCEHVLTTHALREGSYPRPCMGRVRALGASSATADEQRGEPGTARTGQDTRPAGESNPLPMPAQVLPTNRGVWVRLEELGEQ